MSENTQASFERSETVGKLMLALSKARKAFTPALKDRDNPAYRSKYVPLENIIEATSDALSDNELSLLQLPALDGQDVVLTTILGHSSGEWISGHLRLPGTMRDRFDAQSVGSAITYARRYAQQSMLDIAGEVDDDGNAAAGVGSKDAAQALVPARVADYKEKSKHSVSDKTVTLIPGVQESDGIEINVVYFAANEALAVLLDQGLKDVTKYDASKRSRWMIDEPEPLAILEKITTQLGFKLVRQSSPSSANGPEIVPSPKSTVSGLPILTKVGNVYKNKFALEWDGKKIGCFHPSWQPYLLEAVGKPADFVIKTNGQYINLEEVVSAGGIPWHEGAPALQQELR